MKAITRNWVDAAQVVIWNPENMRPAPLRDRTGIKGGRGFVFYVKGCKT